MANEKSDDYIDLRRVLASKNPRLLKQLPGFAIRYLEKIVHVKDLNAGLNAYKTVYGMKFLDAAIEMFGLNIQTEGLENLEKTERPLIASNHPLGGLDGIAMLQVVGKCKGKVLFPVNDLLMNVVNLREMFIPINKHGSNRQNVQALNEAFASEAAINYFPAGLCSRKQNGVILDLPWQKTFINYSRRHRRTIVPTHIDGANSAFFYNLSNIRKRLGVKANLEMLYLVDEMYKQRDKVLTITMGAPISLDELTGERSDWEWAALMRDYVYTLPHTGAMPFTEWLTQH